MSIGGHVTRLATEKVTKERVIGMELSDRKGDVEEFKLTTKGGRKLTTSVNIITGRGAVSEEGCSPIKFRYSLRIDFD